jgi:hypothetical protein
MELLYLLKPLKLSFIHSDTHPFKNDNPEIKCVFVPESVQYNPPVHCSYALIQLSTNNKTTEWKPDYKLVCKLINNGKQYLLYRHKNEPEITILEHLKNAGSQYNRILSIKKPLFHSDYLSVLSPEEIDYNHSIHNWEKYSMKEQYSLLFTNGEQLKDNNFEIIIDTRNDSGYNRPYVYQFFEGYPCKIHTNKPLFERLNTYNKLKELQVKIISLQDKPNRRKGLKGQLDSYNIPYDIVFGVNGKKSTINPVNQQLYKIDLLNETYLYNSSFRPNGKVLSPGEIGCAISHLKCYENIGNFSLIFEDDAFVDNWDRFFKSIRSLPDPSTFDICYMQNEATWWPPIYNNPINDIICNTKGSVNLSLSYILTKKGKSSLEYLQNVYKQKSGVGIQDKFLCLPSDDLISHASRGGLLYEISPYIRPVSSQHLKSHIGTVDTESTKINNYYTIQVDGIHDNWTGLGNQMFRYAVGKLLAIVTNNNFVINQQSKLNLAFNNIKVENILLKEPSVWEEEDDHKIINNIIMSCNNKTINSDILLKGYLQNASYFEGYEYIVRELFDFKNDIKSEAKKYIQYIKNKYIGKEIVAVHIRVRDFIQETSEFLYELYTPDTLTKNIDLLKGDNYVYLIFSNNIEFARINFYKCFEGLNHEYVNTPHKQLGPHRDGILELAIMTLCDHYIISASTYSWWGAFLSKNDNKKVLAPKVWLNPRREDLKNKDTSGIYCKDWIIN